MIARVVAAVLLAGSPVVGAGAGPVCLVQCYVWPESVLQTELELPDPPPGEFELREPTTGGGRVVALAETAYVAAEAFGAAEVIIKAPQRPNPVEAVPRLLIWVTGYVR